LSDLSSLVVNLHILYAKYAAVDAANAQALIESMATAPDLTKTECEALERRVVDDGWRRISGTVAEPVEYFQRISDSAGGATAAAWGKATAIIDTAAPNVLGYLWFYNSYERLLKLKTKQEKELLRSERVVDAHSKIMLGMVKFPGNLADRVFPTYFCWSEDKETKE